MTSLVQTRICCGSSTFIGLSLTLTSNLLQNCSRSLKSPRSLCYHVRAELPVVQPSKIHGYFYLSRLLQWDFPTSHIYCFNATITAYSQSLWFFAEWDKRKSIASHLAWCKSTWNLEGFGGVKSTSATAVSVLFRWPLSEAQKICLVEYHHIHIPVDIKRYHTIKQLNNRTIMETLMAVVGCM